ncbi:DEKNAAC104440, partial [Brettanomyces naardenensis]
MPELGMVLRNVKDRPQDTIVKSPFGVIRGCGSYIVLFMVDDVPYYIGQTNAPFVYCRQREISSDGRGEGEGTFFFFWRSPALLFFYTPSYPIRGGGSTT